MLNYCVLGRVAKRKINEKQVFAIVSHFVQQIWCQKDERNLITAAKIVILQQTTVSKIQFLALTEH